MCCRRVFLWWVYVLVCRIRYVLCCFCVWFVFLVIVTAFVGLCLFDFCWITMCYVWFVLCLCSLLLFNVVFYLRACVFVRVVVISKCYGYLGVLIVSLSIFIVCVLCVWWWWWCVCVWWWWRGELGGPKSDFVLLLLMPRGCVYVLCSALYTYFLFYVMLCSVFLLCVFWCLFFFCLWMCWIVFVLFLQYSYHIYSYMLFVLGVDHQY